MKLGIMIEGQEGLTWERWRLIMATVERLGFESLWRSDHFVSLLDSDRESLETWVSLTLTAVETTRLRFGPLVCPMTFRHPSLLARMAAAVDHLSAGRLILGLGAGWNEREHRVFGLPFPSADARLDMLEEGLEVISRLMADEPAYFSGRHYRLEGANPRPKPVRAGAVRPIPLLIGGAGERRTLSIVARFADEWDVPGGLSPDAYRRKSERLDQFCRVIDRDPGTILRCASTAYLIGRNERDLQRRGAALKELIPGLAGVHAHAVPEMLRSTGWLVGRPPDFISHLKALSAVGVERVMLQHNDQTDIEALELLAGEVMPFVAD